MLQLRAATKREIAGQNKRSASFAAKGLPTTFRKGKSAKVKKA